MKKVLFLVFSVLLCIFGTTYWHMYETKAWSEWRLQGLYIVDCVIKKENEGWTKEEARQYGDSIEVAIGRKAPLACPYCFIESLIK